MAKLIIDDSYLWGIFNSGLYRREDIKVGIWRAMYGLYWDNDTKWKLAMQRFARRHEPASDWERKLVRFMLLKSCPVISRPKGAACAASYYVAKKIIKWARAEERFLER